MRKHVLFFVFLLIAAFAGAQSVSLETAEQVAKNFWLKKQGTSVTLVQDQSVSDVKGIYIFKNANGKGFVIVSDNENARPILGYSFENDFSNGTTPTNAHEWLKKYDSSNRPDTTNVDNQNKWNALKNYKPIDGASLLGTEKSIEPIVKCTWYQEEPYNNDCPKIGSETALTGCVATAIGQILKTYEFPKEGYGSHTYTHPTIGELSTTMTKYNWNNIKESYTGDPGEEGAEDVAALLYQIGVALEMNYGVDESSSSTTMATVVLQDYFQYKSNTIHYEYFKDFDYEVYKSLILADLKAGRPMLYGGVKSSTGGGHQFILDGYEYDEVTGDMFHINYGWGGDDNGYYTLDQLIYDTEQDVVFGIEPDKSLWVNKHRFDMPSAGGDITLAVRSQYDYKGSASISTNAEWLTLSTTTAVGNGEFTEVVVTATANATGRERSAVITVVQNGETETVTINQLPGSGIAGWYGELTSLESPSKGKLIEGKEIILLPERYGSFAAGQQLLAVSFVTKEDNTYNNKDFTIKIYEDSKTDWRLDNSEYTKNVDGCLGTLVYSQDYTATEFGTQEVKLDEPYVISGKNFWIGLELKGNTSIAYNDNTLIENVCAGPNYFDLSRKRIYEKNASGTQINTNIYNWKTSTDDDGTIYYEKYNKDWVIGFYVTDGVNNEMPIALADNANIQAILLNNFVDEQLAPSQTELSANEDLILYPQVRNIGPLDITEAKKVQSIITAGDKVINTYINPWDWVAEDTWYKWFLTNADRTFTITAEMFNENLLSGTFDVCFNVDYIDQPDVLAADNTYCITVTREVPEFTVEVASANDKQGSARALTDDATYTLGASFTAIATAETGYKFVNWTIDGEEVSTDVEYTFTVTHNANIQANFEPLQYTVSVVVGDNGTVEGAKTYNYGENATVTVTANEGYKFIGFENIETTEPTLKFTVTNDTTFTAIFKKILNVTAVANIENAGTVTINPEDEILEGDEVTVTATVNKGYNFVNWTVGDNEVSDNPEYTFDATDNVALVANFEPIQYTVSVIVGENGTAEGARTYNYGENATVTVTANEGYKFIGFENIETTEPTLKFTVTNDTTFTAIFKKILNVTAVANVENAGTVTVNPEGEILEGDEVTVTAVASKSYVFVGYENIEGNESTLKFMATKDTSFTAIFKRILNITAYVTVEGTGTVTISPKGQIIEGDEVTVTAAPSEGYVFAGFDKIEGTETTLNFIATKDTSFTVNFKKILNIAVSVNDEERGKALLSPEGQIIEGDEVTLTATANEGFVFNYWESNDEIISTDATYTFAASTSTTYIAVFDEKLPDSFVVSASTNNSTFGTVSGTGQYELNANVDLVATANKGYKFVNWTDADGEEVSTEETYSFVATADVELVANFEPIQYTVSVVVGENGTVEGARTYYYGENATVTVTANEGYKFIGFENIEATEPTLTFMVTNDTTFTAIFKKILNIAVSVNDEERGKALLSPEGQIIEGDEVTLTATANEGFVFNYWESNDEIISNSATYTFAASTSTTYIAVFDEKLPDSFVVSASTNNSTFGTVSGTGQYELNANVELVATANEGYKFVNWTDADGEEVSTEETYSFAATADVALTANFEAIQYVVTLTFEGEGTVTGAGTYNYGDEVTITATPAEHNELMFWLDGQLGDMVSTDLSFTITVTSDTTIHAVFVSTLCQIDTYAEFGGTTSGDGAVYKGDEITITAVADEGFEFKYWEDEIGIIVSYDAVYTFEASYSMIYTAVFEKVNQQAQYTVTLTFEGEGTVTGAGTYNYGDEVTITATPAEHNELKFWLNGQEGDMVSTDLSFTITVTSDTTIHAVFVSTLCQIDTYTAFGGTTSGDGAVYKGDEITITAVADEGFEFKQWEDEIGNIVSYDAVYTFEASYSMIYTAVFASKECEPTYGKIDTTACGSFTYNGKTYTESGEYQDKLQNHMGCDSIVTIILTILQPSENTIEETACGSFTYNDVVYTESGTYYHTFTNAEGCDSIVTLNLVINKPTTNLITIVSDEDYILNGTTYSETGVYKQTLTNAVGCDSIITLVYTRVNEYGDIASANSVDSVDAETEIIIRPETFATFTEGQVLQSIKFSIGSSLNFDNKNFTIKIYENVSLNDSLATVDGQYELAEDFEEVYSQEYSAEEYGSQLVTLDTPYEINGSTFWIAIACNDATAFSASHKILSDSVATADSLVSECSKGFLILSDGVLSTNYGYTEFTETVGDEEVTYYQVYDIEFAVSFNVADKTPEEPNAVAKVTEEKMIVYPNPVEDGFYVANGKGKTIEIYTRNGDKVASVPLNGTTWVDASELKAGIYFVRVDKEIRQILKK